VPDHALRNRTKHDQSKPNLNGPDLALPDHASRRQTRPDQTGYDHYTATWS